MVKLFVGGLPDGVDSMRLRQLFSQFVVVNECDVIKDYAFVHVPEESDARTVIDKLDGYILEGKSINIRRSTSKLRKEPGMDKRCFRCGAADHKTPQCPSDPANLKRAANASGIVGGGPEQKRFATDGVVTSDASTFVAVHDAPPISTFTYGSNTGTTNVQADPDPELPRPLDSDLFPLYEQYMESRTKYFYFRERLTKEVKARVHAIPSISAAPLQAPYAVANNNLYSTPPPTGLQYGVQQNLSGGPTQPATYPTTTTGTSHFYANVVSSVNLVGNTYPSTAQVNSQPTRLY